MQNQAISRHSTPGKLLVLSPIFKPLFSDTCSHFFYSKVQDERSFSLSHLMLLKDTFNPTETVHKHKHSGYITGHFVCNSDRRTTLIAEIKSCYIKPKRRENFVRHSTHLNKSSLMRFQSKHTFQMFDTNQKVFTDRFPENPLRNLRCIKD